MQSLLTYATQMSIQVLLLEKHPAVVMGYIKDDKFHPVESKSLEDVAIIANNSKAEAIIFSRDELNAFPNEAEMRLQQNFGFAFGVIGCDGSQVSRIAFWGGKAPIQPLVGRHFVHGIWDCYSAVRDAFIVGKEGMREQGVSSEWPFTSIELPDIPRSDAWWNDGQNLYIDWLEPAGFRKIAKENARPGDGFLMSLRSKTPNHAGLLVGDNKIYHHLPTRLSRTENAGMWNYQAEIWVRFTG